MKFSLSRSLPPSEYERDLERERGKKKKREYLYLSICVLHMDEGGGESFDLRLGKMIAHARGLSEWPIRRSFNFAPNCFCLGFQKRSINLTLTFSHSPSLFPLLLIYFFIFVLNFSIFILFPKPRCRTRRACQPRSCCNYGKVGDHPQRCGSRLFANVLS